MLKKYLICFFISMVPLIELRGGVPYAVVKWASGIPFDIMHCAGNFVIALLLFEPMRALMERLYAKMTR